ncbi:Uncharacterised protein [uncultured archaeon]|nr:Uncharacterised protein [uncultured archaeon]
MGQSETSWQWKIACIGFLGALIGGICTFAGSYYVWDQQQKALEQQQIEEQNNIARALYIDISGIEEKLILSMMSVPENKSKFDDLSFVGYSDIQLYNDNGLYYTFDKDIARFDNATSKDLYNFYDEIIDLESKREYMNTYWDRVNHNEYTLPYELYLAHTYTKDLFTERTPEDIAIAEKLKQELKLKYHANT